MNDLPVMSTRQIIITTIVTTYAPIIPTAGTKMQPIRAPINPPPECLSTLSMYDCTGETANSPYTARYINTHINHMRTRVITSFMIAYELPLLDTAKKLPTRSTSGKIYATIPNKPKRKPLTAFPKLPPIPKLLINKRIETATTIQRNISFLKACCLSI